MVKNIDELNQIVEELFRNLYLEDEHRSRRGIDHGEAEEEYDFRTYYTRSSGDGVPVFDGTGRNHW